MSKKCSAKNRDGNRCGAWAVTGGTKCVLHSDPELAAKMGAKHGRRAVLPTQPDATPMLPPKTAREVRDVLAKTLARVDAHMARVDDTRTANTLAYVATSLIRAIEVADLEAELAEMNALLDTQQEPAS